METYTCAHVPQATRIEMSFVMAGALAAVTMTVSVFVTDLVPEQPPSARAGQRVMIFVWCNFASLNASYL